jgi:hypothetical protein
MHVLPLNVPILVQTLLPLEVSVLKQPLFLDVSMCLVTSSLFYPWRWRCLACSSLWSTQTCLSYFVMHFAMSVSKRLLCTCTCDFVPHLDVFAYKSLCRPCTGLQQLVLHLYTYLFNSSLCCARTGLVYTAACAAPGCTSICEYLFNSSLGCVRRCLAHSSLC